jgi:hypothetical protein
VAPVPCGAAVDEVVEAEDDEPHAARVAAAVARAAMATARDTPGWRRPGRGNAPPFRRIDGRVSLVIFISL